MLFEDALFVLELFDSDSSEAHIKELQLDLCSTCFYGYWSF